MLNAMRPDAHHDDMPREERAAPQVTPKHSTRNASALSVKASHKKPQTVTASTDWESRASHASASLCGTGMSVSEQRLSECACSCAGVRLLVGVQDIVHGCIKPARVLFEAENGARVWRGGGAHKAAVMHHGERAWRRGRDIH